MSKITKNKLALLALAGLSAVASGPAFAGGMTVDSKGGLEVFDADQSNYWFTLSGRLFADQTWFDNHHDDATSFPSGSRIRNLRTTLKGGVGENWVYKVDLDFFDVAGTSAKPRFGEAFLGYSFCKDLWAAVGQVSIPFGLENWASASDIPFMEYSLASNAFSPDYGIGVYGEWHADMFTAAAAVYHPGAGHLEYGDVLSSPAVVPAGQVVGTGQFGSTPGSDPLGYAGRITFSPIHDDYAVYHAGLSARHEKKHEHSNAFNYSTGLEAQARQTPRLFTNIPPNSVKNHTVWGAELAGRWGAFMLSGEYMWADVKRADTYAVDDLRNPGGDLDYHGYYLMASYVLTGETKEYDFDSGTFGKVIPKSRKGAWEISARHSFVDLGDRGLENNRYFFNADFVPTPGFDASGNQVTGAGNKVGSGVANNDIVGSAHSTTVGLTWWVNENVRFLANYVRTDLPGKDVDAFGLRAQVNW